MLTGRALLILTLCVVSWTNATAAFAGNIAAADIGTGLDVTRGLSGGTSAFFLHTDTTAPFVLGPNDDSSLTRYPPNDPLVRMFNPIPAAPDTAIVIDPGLFRSVRTYGSVVGVTGIAKPTEETGFQFALDGSTKLINEGDLVGTISSARVSPATPQLRGSISTLASAQGGASGTAASILFDPVLVPGPSLGYFILNYVDDQAVAHHEYPIKGSLSTTHSGDFSAIEFMAVDSRFLVNSNAGDPINYLWSLTISATGPIDSVDDLTVSFRINPLATLSGGGPIDVLTDSSDNPLSAGAVLGRVHGALSIADGTATLSEVDLEELLADLEWLPAKGYLLILTNADELLAGHPEDYETFIDVVTDVGKEWRPRSAESLRAGRFPFTSAWSCPGNAWTPARTGGLRAWRYDPRERANLPRHAPASGESAIPLLSWR